MITVTFYKENKLSLGVKSNKGILDVESAMQKLYGYKDIPTTTYELISQGEIAQEKLARLVEAALSEDLLFYREDAIKYGPCVPKPQKIICIGLNYKKHASECNMPYPSTPVLFSKFHNTLTGHLQNIQLPAQSSQVDYEAELVIVIGKRAKNVKEEDALSYIYGYCNGNDFSARDLQNKSSQWLLGKSCDQFCPIGPYLVSSNEITNPNQLRIRSFVNDELRQDSCTSDMIYHCEELVSYISKHMTLESGDIILTGTPEGVILGYPEEKRVWLKRGDKVSVEIEHLGRLTNMLVNYPNHQ
ncbi:fumarylacetoacetate hydrolase family protein [Metabacillus fastidiosus]|uniref:fumarylacetoacetate hydrolase family protein n=1 Tax=Metabacillus fastidiosus TaxID=1458 RepID=UPI003D28E8E4